MQSYFNSDISDMGVIAYPCEHRGHRVKLYICPHIEYLKISHNCTFQPSKVVVPVLIVDSPMDYPVT